MPTPLRIRLFMLAFILLILPALHAQTALQFISVTPCRVADTRLATGEFGGPPIVGQTSRDFKITDSACNIPVTAAAYSLNVTVVPSGPLGYLTVWPAGETKPVISTLNSLDGRIKANAAIVPAGANGAISIFASNTTNVVLDIDGYFAPVTDSTLAFFPLTPCRVADTRRAQGTFGGPDLKTGQQRDFPLLASACSIPNNAQGYSLNFTVVPKGPLGYLTVWPTGEPKPLVSTLNALTGVITANAAIVPAGVSGAISVYVTNETDLVIDIDGYFAAANGGPTPLSLYTLPPCRVLDTRKVIRAFSGTLPVYVLASPCNVPSAEAYVLNATVVPQNGSPLGYLTLWPDAEGQPLVSTLNALDGQITSNMAIVPTLNGAVDAFASNPTDLVVDIFSYFAPIAPLAITTASLPSGTVNYAYSTSLGASGGVLPYTWSVSSGNLPPGLNLAPGSGLISGTPTITGDYPLTVQVTDSNSPPAMVNVPFDILISGTLSPLSIVTASLPSGTQNTTYNTMLAATGGVTPYTWSVIAGSLPVGLSLNSATGLISGTPSGIGTSNFTVQVSDSETPAVSASAQLSITLKPAVPLSIITTSLPSGTAGTPYSSTVTAVGGLIPYTWSVTSGKFPTGLTLNSSSGAITGTPSVVGTSNFTVQVVDSESPQVVATAQLSITIGPSGGNGDPGTLKGNYVFYLNGFNPGPWTLAGSFVSDGKGNISSGVVDGNSVTGQPFNTPITGSYSISSSGLNTMTLQGASWGPVTYAFVLSSSGSGRIIEYDETGDQGSRGAGVLRKADPTAFSLSKLNGGWVLGLIGANYAGERLVVVGQSTLSGGNISNGTLDINEAGTYGTGTFTGAFSAVDSQTGRATVTIQSDEGITHQVVYVVSTGEMAMETIESQHPDVGTLLQQSGPFNNASLNGAAVLYYQDIHAGDGLDQSGAMIISTDGKGGGTVIAADEDLAGTITQKSSGPANYVVASNGALTFSGGGGVPAGFLISQNIAFVVGTGSNSIFGTMQPQTGGPFSNASLQGTYPAGSLAPLDSANAENEIDVMSADGVGTMNISEDSSGPGGLDQTFGTIGSYNIAANGRGTGAAQGDPAPAVIYMISPTKAIILLTEPDARVLVFQR